MKFSSTLLGSLALLLLGSLSASADTLYSDKISVTGTIQQPPPSVGAPAVVMPVTIANVLTLLGLSDDPKTLRWYFDDKYNDNTSTSIVIAPKGTKPSDNATPLVTLYATPNIFGTDFVGGKIRRGLNGFGESPVILTTTEGGAAAVSLTATSYYKGAYSGRHETDTITILAHGTIGGVDTIISCKIKDSY
jgi:hypothetical protein